VKKKLFKKKERKISSATMSNEMADKNKPGDYFNRPEKTGAWKGFSQFMWNSDTKQFMGRTSGSWGKCVVAPPRNKIFEKRRRKSVAIRDFPFGNSAKREREIYFITKYWQCGSRLLAPITIHTAAIFRLSHKFSLIIFQERKDMSSLCKFYVSE
jgi:Sodium / potassium ATPase beta chain